MKSICVFGPTASGKTDIAESIGRFFPIEIINVDCIQSYKYLKIGANKPEIGNTNYHLLDFLPLDESYNIFEFVKDCKRISQDIINRGNLPVLAGGSAFYFSALFNGLPSSPKSNLKIRNQVNQIALDKGVDYLYKDLVQNYGSINIHPNHTYKLKRAYEIHLVSGKMFDEFNLLPSGYNFQTLNIFLNLEKEELYKKINKRVDYMIDVGLEDEVKYLTKLGYNQYTEALRKSIGYKEFFIYDNINTISEKIKLNTRHYAKRQITFFKKLKSEKFNPKYKDKILRKIESFLTNTDT